MFYQTLFLSAIIGLALIWAANKLWPNTGQDGKYWARPLLTLSGVAMIALVIWLLLQIMIGLPSLAQTIDLPAVLTGFLIAYGFQNAILLIKERAKNKLK